MKFYTLVLLLCSSTAFAEPSPLPSVAPAPSVSPIPTLSTKLPNELVFVDKDIEKAFAGTNYIIGTPSVVQMTRELKRLREVLQKKKEVKHVD